MVAVCRWVSHLWAWIQQEMHAGPSVVLALGAVAVLLGADAFHGLSKVLLLGAGIALVRDEREWLLTLFSLALVAAFVFGR